MSDVECDHVVVDRDYGAVEDSAGKRSPCPMTRTLDDSSLITATLHSVHHTDEQSFRQCDEHFVDECDEHVVDECDEQSDNDLCVSDQVSHRVTHEITSRVTHRITSDTIRSTNVNKKTTRLNSFKLHSANLLKADNFLFGTGSKCRRSRRAQACPRDERLSCDTLPGHNLDSTELTCLDLNDDEVHLYLKSHQEIESLQLMNSA